MGTVKKKRGRNKHRYKKVEGACCVNCRYYAIKFSIPYGGYIEGCANPDPLVGKFGQCCFIPSDNYINNDK